MSPEQFLHSKDANLQKSEAVQDAVEKRNRLNLARRRELLSNKENGKETEEFKAELESLKKIPNSPEAVIGAYLKRLENIFLIEDQNKRTRNLELLKPYIFEEFTIKEEDIPESYWNLRRKIAEERGENYPEEITDEMRKAAFEQISSDQKSSLSIWLEYLSSPQAPYPAWFKFFAINSILNLSEYNKSKKSFPKRTKSTTALFPDIQSEALTETYNNFEALLQGKEVVNPIPEPDNPHARDEKKAVSDEEFTEIMSQRNFAKYYAFHIEYNVSYKELWHITEGEWKKYSSGEGKEFVESIQGKGTGWCSAGVTMAELQLSMGDFHVYFSNNKLGDPTIPRLAIRMEEDQIAEVRGVDADQNTDPYINPVLESKLLEFKEKGEEYQKRLDDMKTVTRLKNKQLEDNKFDIADLRFIYEIDSQIESFGQFSRKDPRINEILSQRNWMDDMQEIYSSTSHEELSKKLIADRKSSLLLENFKDLKGLSTETAVSLIDSGSSSLILRHWESFENLDQETIVEALIRNNQDFLLVKNLNIFTELTQQEIVDLLFKYKNGTIVVEKFDIFDEIDQRSVYDRLLKMGKANFIAINVGKFTELDPTKIAEELTKAGYIDKVFNRYENFGELNDQYFAEYAVVSGNTDDLARNLSKFTTIEGDAVVDKLIMQGFGDDLARSIDVFVDIDKQDIADRLTQKGQVDGLLSNIENFSNVSLDMEKIGEIFLQGLLDKNVSVKNIDKFPKEFQLKCAEALIDKGNTQVFPKNIENFDKEIHKDISLKILNYIEEDLKSRKYFLEAIFDRFNNFSEIDSAVAYKLIELNKKSAVFENIEKYTDLDHQELVNKIDLAEVAGNLHKLRNLNQETFEKLLYTPTKDSSGRGVNFHYLLNNLDNFIITDYQAIADKLIELNQGQELINSLYKFQNLSPETARELLPLNGNIIARHLDKFPGINQQEIADDLISQNQEKCIAENLFNFTEISQETLEKIITKETESYVAQNMVFLDFNRFDQDALAVRLLEVGNNVYFSGFRELPKYEFLTKEQMKQLNDLPQNMRADAALKMANERSNV